MQNGDPLDVPAAPLARMLESQTFSMGTVVAGNDLTAFAFIEFPPEPATSGMPEPGCTTRQTVKSCRLAVIWSCLPFVLPS